MRHTDMAKKRGQRNRRFILHVALVLSVALLIPSFALAIPTWYDIRFTGADIWTYSADNASQARTDQNAPRRYRDWTQTNPVQATTYGLAGGLPGTGFNPWVLTSGFTFDQFSLWGKGGVGAAAWGEKYLSVADDINNGVTSWRLIQKPTGWTDGIVLSNQSYNPGSGAFPVWRSGTGQTLGLSNMNDNSFIYEFQVLISNPETAFEPDGKLRVYFGGYSDDQQMLGPQNYEVSGVMLLTATKVPEPGTLMLLGFGLVGLVVARRGKR